MRKIIFFSALLALFSISSAGAASPDALMEELGGLQTAWAAINYQTPDADKEAAFKSLVAKAERLTQKYPQRAEPKIWEAIIRAGYAGSMGGVSSLFYAMPQMKQGRDLLLQAEQIDPKVLNGSTYTTLGSFYYMVPGGLIGYGDAEKALSYLEKALEIAPQDMDANYFYADYWLEQKDFVKAKNHFEKVLALPDVAGRPVYSKGRKAEAAKKLAQVSEHLAAAR
ncbi:MAG: tetratricopeptide repeat protein [Gammaproteobacteria bacterium]|nr:tetratricopeptide repeat protein [Gammaproteobacteria bacterium]